MKSVPLCLLFIAGAAQAATAEFPAGVNSNGWLPQLGLLDVTAAPYRADSTGTTDATSAIQNAVDDARDDGLVCIFPEGTYLISDTKTARSQHLPFQSGSAITIWIRSPWPTDRRPAGKTRCR